mmetsp:Transcript_19719/g.23464  ORF Transcript_19719/g.23464 Transcript_19719/m.23464 type:complete len:230 (-) Transcript_19719:19-708(-)
MASMKNKSNFRRLGPSMYFKQHRSQDSTYPAIFLINVPRISGISQSLDAVFSTFGSIQNIELDYRSNINSALIYFEDEGSIREALESDEVSLWSQFSLKVGGKKNVTRKLIEMHNGEIPVSESLQNAADQCMALFEKEEKSEADRRAALRDGPDDDGFVTVTNKRKTREIERGSAFQKKVRKGKSLELKNFYRHQIREEKKDKLSELRERFEYDKAQIKKLQDSKRFRP